MIETLRCHISTLRIEDIADIEKLYANPDVRSYLGGPVEGNLFKEKFAGFFSDETSKHWTIRLKDTDRAIGLISITPHHDGANHEISYQLEPSFWHMGLAREVVGRMVAFAHDEMKLRTILAETQSANTASVKLLKSLGMQLREITTRFDATQMIFEHTPIYLDRWGQPHTPTQDSVVRPRQGAFVILLTRDSLLLGYPNYAPDVLELPGGGIDAGETPQQAALRELYEETGVVLPASAFAPERTFSQQVRFFATDRNEFWDYTQTFFLQTTGLEPFYFTGRQPSQEGAAEWIRRDVLSRLCLHHMHAKALAALGIIAAN